MPRPTRKCNQRKITKKLAVTDNHCAVCLTPREEVAVRGRLSGCDHFFCLPCIEEWAVTSGGTCPLCRTSSRFITKVKLIVSGATPRKSRPSPKSIFIRPARWQAVEDSESHEQSEEQSDSLDDSMFLSDDDEENEESWSSGAESDGTIKRLPKLAELLGAKPNINVQKTPTRTINHHTSPVLLEYTPGTSSECTTDAGNDRGGPAVLESDDETPVRKPRKPGWKGGRAHEGDRGDSTEFESDDETPVRKPRKPGWKGGRAHEGDRGGPVAVMSSVDNNYTYSGAPKEGFLTETPAKSRTRIRPKRARHVATITTAVGPLVGQYPRLDSTKQDKGKTQRRRRLNSIRRLGSSQDSEEEPFLGTSRTCQGSRVISSEDTHTQPVSSHESIFERQSFAQNWRSTLCPDSPSI